MTDLELCGVDSNSKSLPGKETSKRYLGKLIPAPSFPHYGVMYFVPMSLMQITVELKKSCDRRGIFIMHYFSVGDGSLNFRFTSDFCLKFEGGYLRLYAIDYSRGMVPYLMSKIYWIKFLPLLSSEAGSAMVRFPEECEIIEMCHRLRKSWRASRSIPNAHNKFAHFLNRSSRIAEPVPQFERKSNFMRLVGFLLRGKVN
ncbi:hypothetical protein [Pseudomonas fluorescens]|uniref:hypothetical protein n=1 Tax=Pseudomonas fluorescens TaxID=294 RepID=UPI0012400847|nr:hypothetical protein [Pseudomonas fluorescens]VVN09654.1 hypothetical protein PS639_03720 [Pseudomonas fluorescens]